MTNNYYQNHKEKFQKKAHKRFSKSFWTRKKKGCEKGLRKIPQSEEEKEKNCQYNNNLSEDQKQKLVDYMRNYYLAHKKIII